MSYSSEIHTCVCVCVCVCKFICGLVMAVCNINSTNSSLLIL